MHLPIKTKKKGQLGEKLAKKLFEAKGYRFLCQNFYTKFGEIDLIFQDKNTIVFVEVKARTSKTQGLAEEAVTPRKLQTISRVAQIYLASHQLLDSPARIDVVAIDLSTTPEKVKHLLNVTG